MINEAQARAVLGFVMQEFIPFSERARDPYIPIWTEVAGNYMVQPLRGGDPGLISLIPGIGDPYRIGNKVSNSTVLVDPETHQGIESLIAKLMAALFPSTGNWIAAQKRGREDAKSARTVTNLLDYAFGLEGHRRALETTVRSMCVFGTSHIHTRWNLTDRPRVLRGVDIEAGIEIPISQRFGQYPYIDDAELVNVDIMDMFIDPGDPELRKMCGAARRFNTRASKLRAMARRGQYDKQAVHDLISRGIPSGSWKERGDKSWRPELEHERFESVPSMQKATGFEYFGEIPPDVWDYADGEQWRMITIVGDTVVQDIAWPLDHYRVPFFDFTLTPMAGRHYGMGPGEATRYQQDFLNVLLMQLADATVRSVHPPIIFNRDDEIDVAALQAWSPDVPIASDRPQDVRVLSVGADKQSAFALFQQIKQSVRENSGVLGSVQGIGLGINRASATEAQKTFQFAMDRPEMAVTYLEQECLPPIGKSIVGLYQRNMTDGDELTARVGEDPAPIPLAEIHGDFDIKCVGSRIYASKQNFIALLDRIIQVGQIPQAGNLYDWKEITKRLFEMAGLDEMAQGDLAEPMNVMQNLLMQRLSGPQQALGNSNGTLPAAPGGMPSQQGAGQ